MEVKEANLWLKINDIQYTQTLILRWYIADRLNIN